MRSLFPLMLAVAGCLPTHADRTEPEVPQGVRVERVEAGEPTWLLPLEGITRAADRARLGLPLGGRLEARPVRIGDRVERGDVLARLDSAPFRNGVSARVAQAAELDERIAQLDRELARLAALDVRGSVTAVERERVQADRNAAQAASSALDAQLAENRRQLADSVLTAPFAGVVVAVLAEPGETLGAGEPIVELAGDGVEVVVEVPERAWVALHPDIRAQVRLPALGLEDDAHIVDLAAAGGARGGLFPVVLGIPAGERRVSGLTAEVQLQIPREPGLVAPLRSIVDPTGASPAVYVVEEGLARRQSVELGSLVGEHVVLSGIDLGDEVIVAGHAQLLDGQRVEVLRD